MFTGIIEAKVPIVSIINKNNSQVFSLKFTKSLLLNLNLGASVSNNGCCLTVSNIFNDIVDFYVIEETLKITNLKYVKVGDKINIERSASIYKEIGGHLINGHIISTAKLLKIYSYGESKQFSIKLNIKKYNKYFFYKGNIAIDGVSLTINKIKNYIIYVNLIPETIIKTTLGEKKIGDILNVEIESHTQIIVDSIERILNKRLKYIIK